MPDDLRVSCPECGTNYRLKSRQAVGRKMNCRNCGDSFVARLQEDDSEFVPVEDDDSSGEEWAPLARRPGRTRSKARSRQGFQLDWRVAAAAGAVLVVVIGLVAAISLIPSRAVADSPDAVYRDLGAAMSDIRNTLDSIRDPGSRKAAIQKFKDMKPRFQDLIIRACLLEPVPEQEYKDLAAKYKDSLELDRQDGKGISQRINDAGQGGVDLDSVVFVLAIEYHAAIDVLRETLRQPVEPRDAADRFEHDELQIKRRLMRRLATVKSSAELAAAMADCKAAAAEIEELATQRSSAEPGAASNRAQYAECRAAMNHATDRLQLVLELRYGKQDGLGQALAAVKMAEELVVNPLPKGVKRTIIFNQPAASATPAAAPPAAGGKKKEGFGLPD